MEESLTVPRIHPALRNHYSLAQALWELGRRADAAVHAREACQQAWHDGPPHCDYWKLRDARELLLAMSETVPAIAIVGRANVKVVLEDETRAFITELQNKRSRL